MTSLRAPLAAVVASALTTLIVVAAARAADPAVAATRRRRWAGHALGGLAGGLAGRLVLDRTTQQVVLETPDTLVAALVLGAAALAGGWVAMTWEPGPVLAAAPLAACAAVPAALTGALSPAALFGLGVAGLSPPGPSSRPEVLAVAAGAVAAAAAAGLSQLRLE